MQDRILTPHEFGDCRAFESGIETRLSQTSTVTVGAVIDPPMPAFYHLPQSIDEVVDHTVARVLDQLGIDHPATLRWSGKMGVGTDAD